MEFENQIFQAWKVMELRLGHGKSWKINQMVAAFLTRVHVFDLYTHYHCPLSDSVRWYSTCIWKSDLFDMHLIKQSWKDMENGHQWSWKVLENAHKKVLESHGKPLSVFCRLTLQGDRRKIDIVCVPYVICVLKKYPQWEFWTRKAPLRTSVYV